MAPISEYGTGPCRVSDTEVVHLVDLVTKDHWNLQFGDDYLHLLFDKTNPRKKDPTPSEREAHVQQEREMLQARILEMSQQNAELAGALEEARRTHAERDNASLADLEAHAQLPQKEGAVQLLHEELAAYKAEYNEMSVRLEQTLQDLHVLGDHNAELAHELAIRSRERENLAARVVAAEEAAEAAKDQMRVLSEREVAPASDGVEAEQSQNMLLDTDEHLYARSRQVEALEEAREEAAELTAQTQDVARLQEELACVVKEMDAFRAAALHEAEAARVQLKATANERDALAKQVEADLGRAWEFDQLQMKVEDLTLKMETLIADRDGLARQLSELQGNSTAAVKEVELRVAEAQAAAALRGKQLEQLTSQLHLLQREEQSQVAEKERLLAQCAAAESQLAQAASRLREQEMENKNIKNNLDKAVLDAAALQEYNRELKHTVEARALELAKALEAGTAAKQRWESAAAQLALETQERTSLAKQLAQTEAHLAAVATQQALMAKELEGRAVHGAATEQELERLTRERAAAAAQLKVAREELVELETVCVRQKEAAELQLDETAAQMQADLETARTELESVLAAAARGEEARTSDWEELHAALEHAQVLQKFNTCLSRDLATSTAQAAEASREKARCKEEAAALREQNTALRAELENVKALTQIVQDRALLAEGRDVLSQQKAAAAVDKLALLAKERDDLAARLAEASVGGAELLTLRAEAATASSKLSCVMSERDLDARQWQEEREEAAHTLQRLTAAMEELAQKTRECDSLQHQVLLLKAEAKDEKGRREEEEMKYSTTSVDLQAKTEESNKLKDKLTGANDETSYLRLVNTKLVLLLKTKTQELEAQTTERGEEQRLARLSEQELERHKKELAAAALNSDALDWLRRTLEETQKQLQAVNLERAKLSAALTKLQEQCNEKDAQLAFILGEDVNMKLKECSEMEAQLARAVKETEELKRRRERVTGASAKCNASSQQGKSITPPVLEDASGDTKLTSGPMSPSMLPHWLLISDALSFLSPTSTE